MLGALSGQTSSPSGSKVVFPYFRCCFSVVGWLFCMNRWWILSPKTGSSLDEDWLHILFACVGFTAFHLSFSWSLCFCLSSSNSGFDSYFLAVLMEEILGPRRDVFQARCTWDQLIAVFHNKLPLEPRQMTTPTRRASFQEWIWYFAAGVVQAVMLFW